MLSPHVDAVCGGISQGSGGDPASEMLAASPLRDLKEGVAYCWTTPRMRAALWIAFLANLTPIR